MPRNSVGIMNVESKQIQDLKFYVRRNIAEPSDTHLGFFTPKNASNWLWPVNGIVIDSQLLLFGWEVTSDASALQFAIVGTRLIRIPNFADDNPLQWQYTVEPIPFTNSTDNWCTALARDGDLVWLLGQATVAGIGSTTLAQISVDALIAGDWSKLLVYTAAQQWRSLTSYNGPRAALVPMGPPETTLQYLSTVRRWMFLSVPFGATKLVAYTAKRVEGPWNEHTVMQLPSPYNEWPSVFCYAPKVHLELSDVANGVIYATVMCNTKKVSDLNTQLSIYVPVPVTIKLQH